MVMPGPDTRVVEIRVPGLVGTSGESLLDSTSVVDVAGDGIGRLIRPSDRLRRPAPGPVLPALGRSIPRILEGYLWSGMTSGGAAKATWALLFPFSLANVAHWMLPPVPEGKRFAAMLGTACRAILRVASLLLTMLLISQLAVVSLDLFAAQCLAPGSRCLAGAPSFLRDFAPLRTAIGVVPLLALIFVLDRIPSSDWRSRNRLHRVHSSAPLQPQDMPRTPGLRTLHTVAALTCVALPLLGGPFRLPTTTFDLVVWICALTLVLAALVASTVGFSAGPVIRGGLIAPAVALVGIAVVRRTPLPAGLPGGGLGGADGTVEALGAAMVAVTVLFALMLIPAALLGRSTWKHLPHRLRPWLGGWAAAPVVALAGLLGGGFGAGLAVALRQVVGASDLRLPDTYVLVTVLWGAGLALAVVLGVLGFAVAVPLRRLRRGVPKIVALMEIGKAQEEEAARVWARASWERKHLHHLALAVALAMAAGGGVLLVLRFGFGQLPGWFSTLSGIGVFALGALAAGLLRVVFAAATTPKRSRHLGALADLVCFWPRAAHPTVPPSYALKVVPELADRVKEHLADPGTRVVLSGYNLGSLLTVLAAARVIADLPPEDRDRVGLLTAGSPLQWGYQRAFPAMLPQAQLSELYKDLGGRWRSLCRGTDIFGGGVTTWRHRVVAGKLLGDGYLPGGGTGPLAAEADEQGVVVLGGDHWLPDPMRGPTGRHRWAPGVLKHTDYVVDAEWDNAVAMAAGLGRPRPKNPWGEQGSLFGDFPQMR